MSDIEIIFQIVLIALGMVILSLVLNKIMGLKQDTALELRQKTMNLQERMQTAQALQDARMMLELQAEMKELMSMMLKKQLIPLSIRCVIFLGIFSVLGFIYGQYAYWYWTYLISSLSFSLIWYGIRKLYYKATGKEQKGGGVLSGLMGTMNQGINPTEEFVHYSTPTPIKPQTWKEKLPSTEDETKEKNGENRSPADWKNKLQKG